MAPTNTSTEIVKGMRASLGLLFLLVLATSGFAQAPFICTTNGSAITITGYTGPGGAVTIPSTINGLPVTDIGSNAFYLSTNLASVVFPEGLTNIDHAAFQFCVNLTNVTFPPVLITIGDDAFDGCASLPLVAIPDGVMVIGIAAFEDCFSLAAVQLPGSLIDIGDSAFYGCFSLGSITIPPGVTNIGNSVLGNCSLLTNAIIGPGVTNIGEGAFADSPNLAGILFEGNAPGVEGNPADGYVFQADTNVTVYYLTNTAGWSNMYQGVPALPWNPQIQTSGPNFGVMSNQFGFNVVATTNIPVLLQACTDLVQQLWTPLTNVNLTNGLYYYSEPLQTNAGGRFFRVSFP